MINSNEFVHLHLHTEYSLLDGACRIDRLMEHVKSLGQEAVAITDHGVMFGCVDFYKAAKKAGIKPIIGCEVYVAPRSRKDMVYRVDSTPYHLILLCKNEIGYKNLIKMVSIANAEGFYNKPRVDRELLEQYHEGLICLSACLAGEVPQLLLSGDYDSAVEVASYYSNLFGEGNYYIEIQDHGIEEQQRILPDLVRISKQLNIPLVATNDCHYIEKKDHEMQRVLICIQTNHTIDEEVLEFKTNEFYVKSTEEMANLFSAFPEAITNTKVIADQCNFDFEFGVTKLPAFNTPDGSDNLDFFNRLCEEGLHRRYGDAITDEIRERLAYEQSVITNMGYVNYYLIVWDFINYAKTHDIPVGPGRGSGAGSIAAYCMGITDLDPIQYNLIFERFLNPERVSMPDFDIDFCYEKRSMVIDYVIRKYGATHVAQIITFGTMAARLATRDVGRVLGIPYGQTDKVAKMIPAELNITIAKAFQRNPELKQLYDEDPEVHRLLDMAMQIEGMPRHASTHAAGIVITQDEVSDYVPLAKNDENMVTQFTMTTLEELGLLKMDFLGLRTLTVIDDAQKQIRLSNPSFDINSVSFEDPDVYQMLSAGDTIGVFQLESGGMRQLLINMGPKNLEDIIALISLYRPGPMDSIPTYLENRKNPDHTSYLTPELEPILDVTNGVIIYQEQVMQICRELAGFSLGKADIVRRAMAKKKHDVMEQSGKEFIAGCEERGIAATAAKKIYDEMASFASYAFNKSHAAVYADVAYQTAYLKCHYPVEFFAALLTSIVDNTDKIIEYIAECQKKGISLLPPSVNTSMHGFTVENGAIRFGLLAIKNVGKGLIAQIEEERKKNGAFTSFTDFCFRVFGNELNKRALENMILSGCFDEFGLTRQTLVQNMERVLELISKEKKSQVDGQISFMDLDTQATGASGHTDEYLTAFDEYPQAELLMKEKGATGLYLTSHPLKEYAQLIEAKHYPTIRKITANAEQYDNKTVEVLCEISTIRRKVTKSNETMGFVTLEDLTGTMEMMVFPKSLAQFNHLLQENSIVLCSGRISSKEEEDPKLLCASITDVSSLKMPTTPAAAKPTKQGKNLYLRFTSEEDSRIKQATAMVELFPGDCSVHFYFEDSKKHVLSSVLHASEEEFLQSKLKNLLGEDNVVYK